MPHLLYNRRICLTFLVWLSLQVPDSNYPMGCGKPNDEDNPPVPLKQSDEVVLTSKESEASDNGQMYHINNTSQPAIMPLTFVSGPNSSWENAYGMHQPYTQDPRNNLPGFIRPGTPPNAHIDDAFIDLLRGTPVELLRIFIEVTF